MAVCVIDCLFDEQCMQVYTHICGVGRCIFSCAATMRGSQNLHSLRVAYLAFRLCSVLCLAGESLVRLYVQAGRMQAGDCASTGDKIYWTLVIFGFKEWPADISVCVRWPSAGAS